MDKQTNFWQGQKAKRVFLKEMYRKQNIFKSSPINDFLSNPLIVPCCDAPAL